MGPPLRYMHHHLPLTTSPPHLWRHPVFALHLLPRVVCSTCHGILAQHVPLYVWQVGFACVAAWQAVCFLFAACCSQQHALCHCALALCLPPTTHCTLAPCTAALLCCGRRSGPDVWWRCLLLMFNPQCYCYVVPSRVRACRQHSSVVVCNGCTNAALWQLVGLPSS